MRSLFSPFSASFYAFLIKRIKKEFRSVRLRLQWDGGEAGWAGLGLGCGFLGDLQPWREEIGYL